MKTIIAVLLLILTWNSGQSQCIFNLNDTIKAGADFFVQGNVSGLINDDMSSNQALCGIKLHFRHEFIGNLQIELISPAGQKVLLVGPTVSGNLTSGSEWNITYVRCGDTAVPDPGLPQTFDNTAPWVIGANYTGSYYPFFNCLEDFNIGSANGIWQLHITNAAFYTGSLIDFSLIFCNPDGIDCFPCDAAAGHFVQNNYTFCANDTTLSDFFPDIDYGGVLTDTSHYNYDIVVTSNGNILSINDTINWTLLAPGGYDLYQITYLKNYSPLIQTYINLPFQVLEMKVNTTEICAGISTDSARLQINRVYDLPVKNLILCSGDSLVVSGKKYFQSTFIRDTLQTQAGCDSIININLTFTDVHVEIKADTIDCLDFSAKLDTAGFRMDVPNGLLLNYEWLNDSYQFLSNDGSITVNNPGMYYLHLIILYGNLQCEYFFPKKVLSQVLPPAKPILEPFSPCANLQTRLIMQSDTLRDETHWMIEGNYIDTLFHDTLYITWTQPGTYNVCVWSSNECGVSDTLCQSVTVGNTPKFEIKMDSVTCSGQFEIAVLGNNIQLNWVDHQNNSAYTTTLNGDEVAGSLLPMKDSVHLNYEGQVDGCDISGQTIIRRRPEPEYFVTDTVFCGSGLFQLPVKVNNGTGKLFYTVGGVSDSIAVVPGINYFNVMVASSESIYFDSLVTDFKTCNVYNEDTMLVTIESQPVSVLKDTIEFCNTFGKDGQPKYAMQDLIISGEKSGTWNFSKIPGIKILNDTIDMSNVSVGVYDVNFKTNTAVPPCQDQNYQTVFKIIDCTCPPPGNNLLNQNYSFCNNYGWLNLDSLASVSSGVQWFTWDSGIKTLLAGNGIMLDHGVTGNIQLQLQTIQNWEGECPDSMIINLQISPEQYAGDDFLYEFCEGEQHVLNLDTILNNVVNDGLWIAQQPDYPGFSTAFDPAKHELKTGGLIAGSYNIYKIVAPTSVCQGDTALLSVVVNPIPGVNLKGEGYLDCTTLESKIYLDGNNLANVSSSWFLNSNLVNITLGADSFLVNQAGQYLVISEDGITGCRDTSTFVVEDNSNPIDTLRYNIFPDCNDGGTSLILDVPDGGTPPFRYSLDGGQETIYLQFYDLKHGDHSLLVTDSKNCMYNLNFNIDSSDIYHFELGPDTTIKLGNKVWFEIDFPIGEVFALDVKMNGSPFNYSLGGMWLTPDETIDLEVTLTDNNGCIYIDRKTIFVESSDEIFVPNVFTPNGDGINDYLYIPVNSMVDKVLIFNIYDRWGNHIYGAKDVKPGNESSGWDGRFEGRKMNPGVFVYFIKYLATNGEVYLQKGSFTLIR